MSTDNMNVSGVGRKKTLDPLLKKGKDVIHDGAAMAAAILPAAISGVQNLASSGTMTDTFNSSGSSSSYRE